MRTPLAWTDEPARFVDLQVRHTTTVVVPPEETVVDIVADVSDAGGWSKPSIDRRRLGQLGTAGCAGIRS